MQISVGRDCEEREGEEEGEEEGRRQGGRTGEGGGGGGGRRWEKGETSEKGGRTGKGGGRRRKIGGNDTKTIDESVDYLPVDSLPVSQSKGERRTRGRMSTMSTCVLSCSMYVSSLYVCVSVCLCVCTRFVSLPALLIGFNSLLIVC